MNEPQSMSLKTSEIKILKGGQRGAWIYPVGGDWREKGPV
jgi:hypothetical protein